MLPALEGTLAGLGIDIRAQPNVELDVERARRSRRARSARRSRCPDRVVLVIQPIGGADDWRALFHEAGHTEHFANTSAILSVEERRMGDNAVTEGWASSSSTSSSDPTWLDRRLDFSNPRGFSAEAAAQELWFLRRYCAKLLYELELYRGRRIRVDALALRRDPRRRAQDRAEPDGLARSTSIPASTAPSTCARGRSRRRCATTSARSFGNDWFSKRGAGRSSASCGRSARTRRRTRCSPT